MYHSDRSHTGRCDTLEVQQWTAFGWNNEDDDDEAQFLYVMIANADGTVSALAERSTAALRVAGSIPARNKYVYDLQVDVPGLAVCVCDFLCLGMHPRSTWLKLKPKGK